MPTYPPWLVVRPGAAPILLLAPHGGRRRDLRIPGRHKVNDLHTADVTRELGRLLDAGVVINEHRDRNELDLNRTSQVRREAPWFMDVVGEMLRGMITDAGRALVLVIHGWNVGQVACDIGIGLREHPEGLRAVRPGSGTVSDDFVAACVRPLRERVATDGVVVTIGSRYPAAHPDNLLQLFRLNGDEDDQTSCPIAALRGFGTIDAAQLELAIPLRWPGVRRDRFLGQLASTARSFLAGRLEPPRTRGHTVLVAGRGRLTRRRGIQLTAGDLFVMVSIEAGDGGPVAGRVIVSESPTRLALFTGELVDPSRGWVVPPLVCERAADGSMRFVYDGPVIAFPTHTPFLDLERGLADGRLVEARLDLRFRRTDPAQIAIGSESLGEVHGAIEIEGRRYEIATRGVVTDVELSSRARVPRGRITLPDAACGPLVLATDALESLGSRDRWCAKALVGHRRAGAAYRTVAAVAAIDVSAERGTLVLEGADERDEEVAIVATLERVIPVRRQGPHDTVVETRFALVCVAGQAVGWLEVSATLEAATDLTGG
ncbi:MAG: hypothetical protein IT293_05820 [Deltaproteobacteria bacterium]|nr:hypothetical protein [Deltaproteobacteria bacterium]